MLLKTSGFTVVAVLLLTLGIGLNPARFQPLQEVGLRNLAIKVPQQFTVVHRADMNGARGNFRIRYPAVTTPIWEEIRDRPHVFTGIFGWSQESFNFGQDGEI